MMLDYAPGEALTCQEIRELDVLAIEHVGIPGVVLMENAGRGCALLIAQSLLDPATEHVVILCGPGNNGGDGFVIARHLQNAGVRVTLVLAAPPEKSHGDAGINLAICRRMDIPILQAHEPEGLDAARTAINNAAVVVDALLGTGSTGAPRKAMADLVTAANDAVAARRVAIDIPSGLDGDSGDVHEPCFRAHSTATMVAPKIGFNLESARRVVGRVVVVDIGLPHSLIPGRKNANGP